MTDKDEILRAHHMPTPPWLQPADLDYHPQPSGCVRYLGLAVFLIIAVVQAFAHWNGGLL